jgi:hypothetical protein
VKAFCSTDFMCKVEARDLQAGLALRLPYLGTGILFFQPGLISETCMTIDGISFLVHCSIWTRCFRHIQSLIFTF